MQKVNILGTELKDRSKWESLGMAERYLKTRTAQLILYINNRELNMASQDEGFRSFIEHAGLTLWSDPDVSQMVGVKNAYRHKEVEDKEFLQELLHRLARNHKAVLVVSQTQDKADALKQELFVLQSGLSIVSSFALPEDDGTIEQTVNQINSMAPSVIIARMPVEKQYRFLSKAIMMINTSIWLALPEDMNLTKQDPLMKRLVRKIKTWSLSKKVKKYEPEEKPEENKSKSPDDMDL